MHDDNIARSLQCTWSSSFLLYLYSLLSDVEITLDALLKPKATSLPGHIQAVYVQSICKLYSSLMNKAEKEVCGLSLQNKVQIFFIFINHKKYREITH